VSITVQIAVKVDDCVSAADIVSINNAGSRARTLCVSAIAPIFSLVLTGNTCPAAVEKGKAANEVLANMIRLSLQCR